MSRYFPSSPSILIKLFITCDSNGYVQETTSLGKCFVDTFQQLKHPALVGKRTFASLGYPNNPKIIQVSGRDSLRDYERNVKGEDEILIVSGTDVSKEYIQFGIDEIYLKVLNKQSEDGKLTKKKELIDPEFLDLLYMIKSVYDGKIFTDPKVYTTIREANEIDLSNGSHHQWSATPIEKDPAYTIYLCFPRNQQETQIQDLIRKIKTTGDPQNDRTGVGTTSLFGHQMSFDLSKNTFPLMTLRKTFFKGIFEELMWFLRGQTDSKILEEKGVGIWNGNSTREFLDKTGLTNLREGDCGAIYSHQWRHWGADYTGCDKNYTGQGIDQIAWLINEIKTNPASRRLILSGWNVGDLKKMCLPPCHTMYQFNVSKGKLSCHMYQRSSDVLLASMWNISSASLLTILLSSVCGLSPGKLVVSYGDCHIYNNHTESVYQHLIRVPFPYPKLSIKNKRENISDYQIDDIVLEGYLAYPTVKLQMNA